jgi:cation transport regulator ChaC
MPYWVFGYGSLIWKPPLVHRSSSLYLYKWSSFRNKSWVVRPHTVEQKSGYVKNVVRRFAQSSIDHRGIPGAPGRVVTVIDAKEWHRLASSVSLFPFGYMQEEKRTSIANIVGTWGRRRLCLGSRISYKPRKGGWSEGLFRYVCAIVLYSYHDCSADSQNIEKRYIMSCLTRITLMI